MPTPHTPPADDSDPTLTPRTGEGAQSALEALRRQQRRKPGVAQAPARDGTAGEAAPPAPGADPAR